MALPGLAAAGRRLVVTMALVETTGLLAGSGKTTALAVLKDTLVHIPAFSTLLLQNVPCAPA